MGYMGLFGMAKVRFEVTCQWDDEAQIWYVVESNVPGLSAEAASKAEMRAVLAELIPQLVQLNQPDLCKPDDVPLELLFQNRQEMSLRCQ